MKIMYICEYPYVLYKVLLKAALNKKDIYDIVITNGMDGMTNIIRQLKESRLFQNVYFFDIRKLNLKYDLFCIKNEKNVFKKRMNDIRIRLYLYKISNKGLLKNMKVPVDFSKYDRVYCTDVAFVFENYLTVNKIPHITMEHAKDAYAGSNHTLCVSIFHWLEHIFDKYNFVRGGVGNASRYCMAVEINSSDHIAWFLKKKRLIVWNVEQFLGKLSEENVDQILNIYMKSYCPDFDSSIKYNLLLTSPLYLDGIVSSEEEQKTVYREIVRQHALDHGFRLLIKPHPRDKTDYTQIKGILMSRVIPSEIICLSKKVKLHKVAAIASSSLDSFADCADEVIELSESRRKDMIDLCDKTLHSR